MKIRFAHLFVLVFLSVAAALGQAREIRINLVDPAGAAVTDANVRATAGKSEPKPCAKDDNAFVCTIPDSGSILFEITAKGFKPLKIEYAEKDITCCEYVFVLHAQPKT